jgi:hypothetical protein
MSFGSTLYRRLAAAMVFAVVLSSRMMGPEAALSQTFGEPQTVTIAIQIGPIVEVSFPEGTTFSLEVPHRDSMAGGALRGTPAPTVTPVQIPFEVRGNAHAVVSAMPRGVDAASARDGVGVARLQKNGASILDAGELGYQTIVEFPAGTRRGETATGSAAMRANVARSPVSGVVHIVPINKNGAINGTYVGAVEMAAYAEP